MFFYKRINWLFIRLIKRDRILYIAGLEIHDKPVAYLLFDIPGMIDKQVFFVFELELAGIVV